MDFLQQMAERSRERVAEAKRSAQQRCGKCVERALDTPPPPQLRLSGAGFDLIAEVKLRSPAVGALTAGGREHRRARRGYASAGAAAVSVLTEPSRFDGSMAHLRIRRARACAAARARDAQGFPRRRLSGAEARAAGAGGVLADPAHAAAHELEALLAGGAPIRSCSCCSKPSTSRISSSRTT